MNLISPSSAPESPDTARVAGLERYHGFDALRAAMVLLGIVLHAAVCYTSVPIPMAPYHDPASSVVFDWLCAFIHTFRLPTFFVMAGFFASLLAERDGTMGMVRNRWRRLMVPLLVGWPILAPLLVVALVFAWQRHPEFTGRPGALSALSAASNGHDERDGLLAHLWFLYDLFLFCLIAAICRVVGNRFVPACAVLAGRAFRASLKSGTVLVVFPLATALTLYPMRTGSFDTSAWLLPPVRILAAYGIFFGFGWWMFRERSHIPILAQHPWRRIAAGLLLFVPHQVGLAHLQNGAFRPGDLTHLMTIMTGSIASWGLVLGLTGLCLAHFPRPRPWIRYLTDASYFLYLAHLPLVLFLQGVLAPVHLPAIVKFSAVSAVAILTLVGVYQYQVRNSRLGELLNGRRYPKVWPALPAFRTN